MLISDWSSDVCSSDLLGYLDADEYLFIVDRKKDIIIRGGENISCPEVEAAIYAHPDVQECAVFGLPDERLGEVVGAVVWMAPGSKADATLLAAFLGDHLAPFKVPAKIWMVDEALPKLGRSEEHTSELQSLMRISYAVFCLKKKKI